MTLQPGAAAAVGRDRLVDLVRALSILVVVLGHWTMGAILRDTDGQVVVRNVLEVSPALHPLTWLAQVMPLFFLAAGFANAVSLWHGRPVRLFLTGRLDRVLRPTLPFLGLWLLAALLLPALGVPADLLRTAGSNAAMVVWFLAVYLLLVLLAPLQARLRDRRAWLPVWLAPPVALLLDQLQGTSWSGLALLNYLVVFGFAQQLGMLYAAGRLTRLPRRVWAVAAAGALTLLVLATGPGPYPVSMIGLPGQERSNMLPPSVVVILVAVLQVSLLMLAAPALRRWLDRPRVWRATIAVNLTVLTVFLWHLTAFVALAALAVGLGLPLPPLGSATWWLHKPLWLVLAAALTVLLVLALQRWERPRPVARSGLLPWPATVLAAAGLAMVAAAGFAEPFARGGIALAGVRFAAAPGVALVLLAWLLGRQRAES